ncbi:MAG TPA: SMP-30/gluconolactonase/LRE family protein [Magnetospirillaceae bacterium]
MPVEIRDPRFRDVVGDSAELERLATGFGFTEGPVWHPTKQHLTFSDIPNGRMHRWHPSGKTEVYRDPSNKGNGSTLDKQGRLITCEHASSRVVREEADGALTILASHYQGKQLNSPNDVVVRSDGAIFFTDPSFGRMEYFGIRREQELPFRGVYRIDPGKPEPVLLGSDFNQPNGLIFSLDERRLFINDTMGQHIRVFDVDAAGGLSGGAVWAEVKRTETGAADGMKIDRLGNVYCTGEGGIQVFNPMGQLIGIVKTPEKCANFTFGGADFRDLFMTATTSLYRTRVRVPGRPLL